MPLTTQRRNSLLKICWQLEWCFLDSKYLAVFAPDLSASTMRKGPGACIYGLRFAIEKNEFGKQAFCQVVYETQHAFEKIILGKH